MKHFTLNINLMILGFRSEVIPEPDQEHRAEHGADETGDRASRNRRQASNRPGADQRSEDAYRDRRDQTGLHLHEPRGEKSCGGSNHYEKKDRHGNSMTGFAVVRNPYRR